jgi:mannose-1-phosphate guanylyltransferase/phosphomannomutase
MAIKFDKSFLEKSWTHKRGVEGEIKCAILAAGLGKRMDPLTSSHLPKPLFPLGGKLPMAEIWVRRLVESGITDISMNLCVLSETIRRHFRRGTRFGAKITYVEEEKPSGTLGGVCKQVLGRKAKRLSSDKEEEVDLPEFSGSTVLVPSGDVVTNFGSELIEEMYEIHKSVGAGITMVLVPIPWERRKDFGTVVLDATESKDGLVSNFGKLIDFVEKDPNSPSNLNNASIYMIEKELLKELDQHRTEADPTVENPFYDFGKHVFPAMLGRLDYVSLPKEYSLWGIQYDGSWFDVGQKRDYLRVNEVILDGGLNVGLPYEAYPWGYLGTNVAIDFVKTTIIPPVIIGNNCIIERDVTLGPYAIVGDEWIIERGASIRHSVLWDRFPFFGANGEISIQERRTVDRHSVRGGIKIDESIIVGGTIEEDMFEKTVDVQEDGTLSVIDIDYVPDGTRA